MILFTLKYAEKRHINDSSFVKAMNQNINRNLNEKVNVILNKVCEKSDKNGMFKTSQTLWKQEQSWKVTLFAYSSSLNSIQNEVDGNAKADLSTTSNESGQFDCWTTHGRQSWREEEDRVAMDAHLLRPDHDDRPLHIRDPLHDVRPFSFPQTKL